MKEQKKVLFAANLDSFFTKFLIPQLKYFKEQGYEVHIAAKTENINIPYCDKKYNVCFARSLNIKESALSYQQMKEILKNEHYDIISCHTPFGGAITRLAAKSCKVRKKGTKIVYMAHGFHFYKGSPLLNWLLYYNVEKYLAKYTDTIITINLEDYEIAKKHFKTNVEYVAGVGLIADKFKFSMDEKEKKKYREDLGIAEDSFVMIYSAELLPRKNQIWLIETLAPILKENKNFSLILAGKDSMNGKCQKLVKKLDLEAQILFLGFREDIPHLLKIADLAISSSKQEGLPLNIIEAMYVGLPIVATNCRGNSDLIENGKNGFLVDLADKEGFRTCILRIYNGELSQHSIYNYTTIQKFLLENVIEEICTIYKKV